MKPGLVVLWLVVSTAPAQVPNKSSLRVEHACIERKARIDTGTIHVYVHNTGDAAVDIVSLVIEFACESGASEQAARLLAAVDSSEESPPYLWWRSFPPRVAPGGFADVCAKLTRLPERRLTVRVKAADGQEVSCELDRINDALSFAAVGFAKDLRRAYVYLENRTDRELAVRRVWLDERDVTDRARSLWPVIAPGGRGCVVVPLSEKTRPGALLLIRVEADPEGCGVALVRVFRSFPITWLDGSLPEGVPAQAGDGPFRPGHVRNEGLAGFENIMRCPAHAHGTRREAAAMFIRLHERLLAREPHVPGMIYVCRWEKEKNYFVFSELADVVRVMPFAGSPGYQPRPLEHRMQWLTDLAVRAAAPRPVHAVVPIRFADSFQWVRSCTPEEIRALLYLPLSRGARGLCFGKKQDGLTEQAKAMLRKVTGAIVSMRDVLSMAAYLPLGRTDDPQIEAATLLAGDEGLVVFVINHSFKDFDEAHRLVCSPRRSVECRIQLPPGFRAKTVQDVEDPQRRVEWKQSGTVLMLWTDAVEVARPYRVIFAAPPDRADSRTTGEVPSS